MIRNLLSKIFVPFILFSIALFSACAGNARTQALFVIDIQSGYVGLYPKQAFNEFLTNVNNIIDKASSRGIPIIYIRQNGGGDIYDEVHKKSSIEFEKTTQSAFTVDELNDYLKERNIKNIYIVGLDAAYCVSTTAHDSVHRGYKTVVIKDAVITYKDWEEVLRDYEDIDLTLINSEDY